MKCYHCSAPVNNGVKCNYCNSDYKNIKSFGNNYSQLRSEFTESYKKMMNDRSEFFNKLSQSEFLKNYSGLSDCI
jgi:transposase-like protein